LLYEPGSGEILGEFLKTVSGELRRRETRGGD
jgi:hypothetical protein